MVTEVSLLSLNFLASTKTDNLDDPYGFIMLDGAAGSLSDTFDSDFTVARRDEHFSTAKRSLITTNKTLIDTVFEHSEETLYVFCNHPNGSPKCEIFSIAAQKILSSGSQITLEKALLRA